MKYGIAIIALALSPLYLFAYNAKISNDIEVFDQLLSKVQHILGEYKNQQDGFYSVVYQNLLTVYLGEQHPKKKEYLQGILSYLSNNYHTWYDYDNSPRIAVKPATDDGKELIKVEKNLQCPGSVYILKSKNLDEGSQETNHEYNDATGGFKSIYNPYIFEQYCKIDSTYFYFTDTLYLKQTPVTLSSFLKESLKTNDVLGLKRAIEFSDKHNLPILPLLGDMNARQLEYIDTYKGGIFVFSRLQTFEREGYGLFYLTQKGDIFLPYSLLYGFDSVQMSQKTMENQIQLTSDCDGQLYKTHSISEQCKTTLIKHIQELIAKKETSSYPLDKKIKNLLERVDSSNLSLHSYRDQQ